MTEISRLQQGNQESLRSYLRRFEALRFLHPAVEAVDGDAKLRAALTGGMNGMARQVVHDVESLSKPLDDVLAYLNRMAQHEVWIGYNDWPVPTPLRDVVKNKWKNKHEEFTVIGKEKMKQITCFLCGWEGHKAKNCDGKAIRPGPGLRTVEEKKKFWEKKRERDEKKSKSAETEKVVVRSDKKTGDGDCALFTLKVLVNGFEMEVMADSGATVNVMQMEWANVHLAEISRKACDMVLQPVVGNKVVAKQIITVPVCVQGGRMMDVDFVLLDTVNVEPVLTCGTLANLGVQSVSNGSVTLNIETSLANPEKSGEVESGMSPLLTDECDCWMRK